MSLDLSTVGQKSQPYEFKYDWKACALYALGIGSKKSELDYVFEGKGPKVYPTFAVVPVYPPVGELLVKTGANLAMVIHGGQVVRMHRPIPSEGTFNTVATIQGIYDMKKLGQVAIHTETTVNGERCFETDWSILIRGAGGFSGPHPPKAEAPSIPEGKKADYVEEETTLPEQALLYRLSGDLNPLHADPDFAAMVGFPQGPILHGLCTYGFVARAVVRHACGGDANKLKAFGAQFRKPVWPGEVIRTDIYALDGGRVALEAYAGGRSEPVLANAWAEIG